jgi:HD-GYP domain-containing protein (c-di-GMP phosphodiesterase class II)
MTSSHASVLLPDPLCGENNGSESGAKALSVRDAQLVQCVSELRTRIGKNDHDGSGLALLTELSEAVECLREERDGMTDELLGVYEQLGVVFEVTSRLPTVHNEPDVINLFTDALHHSFQGDDVVFLKSKSERPSSKAEQWLTDLIDGVRSQKRAVVEALPEIAGMPYCREILLGPIIAGTRGSEEAVDSFVGVVSIARQQQGPPFRASDMLLVDSLTSFCGDVIRNHRLIGELGETSVAMVQALVNAVDQKDPYTSGHSLRVGYYSTLLGAKIGQSEVDLQMLQWSALLHDVGKIGTRDDVLNKQGRLTAEEFDHIKEHPVGSYQVVRKVPQLAAALDGVLHHHEHYDGGGYPSGLAGEEIPLQARVIQLADVFDALTSTRSYRGANDWSEALKIMASESGTTLDPNLRLVFDELIRTTIENVPKGWIGLQEQANQFTKLGPQQTKTDGVK